MNQDSLIAAYKSQLSNRFYSNSIALEVLIGLIMILMLTVEVVKFFKKTYQWQTQLEVNNEQKYSEQSKEMLKEKTQIDNHIKLTNHARDEVLKQRQLAIKQIKKQAQIPPLIRVQQILKNKIPQLAIIAVNVVMIASYEFVTISAYIAIVLIVIAQILGIKQTQHLNLRFVLQIISKLLMLAWYINIFTVAKPTQTI